MPSASELDHRSIDSVPSGHSVRQVVVNYAASAGPAQAVADAIKASGGDAIVVGADMSKKEDIDRCHFLPRPAQSRPALHGHGLPLHNPAMLCTAVHFYCELCSAHCFDARPLLSSLGAPSPLEWEPVCIKV